MPVSDSRFDKLINKVEGLSEKLSDFGERIARLEGPLVPAKSTWRTLAKWLLGVLSGALLIYLAWLGSTVYSQGNKLASMARDIDYIVKALPAAQLVKFQSVTPSEENLAKTRQAIQESRAEKVIIPPQVITSVGSKLIQTSFSNPKLSEAAWSTTLDLINYRSFLTSIQSPNYGAPLQTPSHAQPPHQTLPPGIVLYWHGGGFSRATQDIDGMMLEDLVIRDAHIIYNGGPLILKNVTFQNCTFTIRLVPPSQRLTEALLASSTVTLDIRG